MADPSDVSCTQSPWVLPAAVAAMVAVVTCSAAATFVARWWTACGTATMSYTARCKGSPAPVNHELQRSSAEAACTYVLVLLQTAVPPQLQKATNTGIKHHDRHVQGMEEVACLLLGSAASQGTDNQSQS